MRRNGRYYPHGAAVYGLYGGAGSPRPRDFTAPGVIRGMRTRIIDWAEQRNRGRSRTRRAGRGGGGGGRYMMSGALPWPR